MKLSCLVLFYNDILYRYRKSINIKRKVVKIRGLSENT
nr:MAG TPA: hypothetical protein [Caudoviricetes sp.]